MVRLATKADLPGILELLKEFHAESLDLYKLGLDEKVTEILMNKLYETSFVLEMEGKIVGVLGGMIANYPLNGELLYQELVWFVNKKYRLHGIRLFRKLEEYCHTNKIKKIGVALMANSKAKKLETFYERMGFEYLEKHYIKNLEGTDAEGRDRSDGETKGRSTSN